MYVGVSSVSLWVCAALFEGQVTDLHSGDELGDAWCLPSFKMEMRQILRPNKGTSPRTITGDEGHGLGLSHRVVTQSWLLQRGLKG